MAMHRLKYGWNWTAEERENLKRPVWSTLASLRKLTEQLRRIELHIPEFGEEAAKICAPMIALERKLSSLDIRNNGRKYQPASPEEIAHLVAEFPTLWKTWSDFASSPAFAAAAKAKNREIRRHNTYARERNKAVMAAETDVWRQFSAALQKVDDGDIMGGLDDAAKLGIL